MGTVCAWVDCEATFEGTMPDGWRWMLVYWWEHPASNQKMGKVEFATKKVPLLHVPIGKKSFGADKLKENFLALASVILRAKPPTSKGTYLQKVTLSTTMSPGIGLDPSSVQASATS